MSCCHVMEWSVTNSWVHYWLIYWWNDCLICDLLRSLILINWLICECDLLMGLWLTDWFCDWFIGCLMVMDGGMAVPRGCLVRANTPESRSAMQVRPLWVIWQLNSHAWDMLLLLPAWSIAAVFHPLPFPAPFHQVVPRTTEKFLFLSLRGHRTCLVQ